MPLSGIWSQTLLDVTAKFSADSSWACKVWLMGLVWLGQRAEGTAQLHGLLLWRLRLASPMWLYQDKIS